MSLLNGVGGLLGSLTGALGTSTTGQGASLPLSNLISNLVSVSPTTGGANSILDIGLLDSDGVIKLSLPGTDLVVLPNNGGIVPGDLLGSLLGGDSLDSGVLNGILDLGNLMGTGGLLDLTGVLGGTGLLDLDGVLGGVLELLTGDLGLTPDDVLDPDGEIDPDQFDVVSIGTDASDVFTITTASTYVDGRGDVDVANFARSAADFSFAVGKDAIIFSDGAELFYFKDVERVSFFEADLYLDTGVGENAGVGFRLYQAAFDRMPDNDGLKYWIDRIDNDTDLHDVANGFIFSAEFALAYGTNLSNSQYVAELYDNVLGRAGEAAGAAFWENRLNSGAEDRATVLLQFSESAENVALVATTIENGFTLA